MRSLSLLLAIIGLVFLSRPAVAEYGYQNGQRVWYVHGAEAKGGDPDMFIQQIAVLRSQGVKAILVGPICLSSCTLYTALLKDGLLCARPGTKLAFHQYVIVKNMVVEGGIIKSFEIAGTAEKLDPPAYRRIMRTYPVHVKREVYKRRPAGLPPHGQELYIAASALRIPTC